ncbi:MAG: heparinase II/III family protein [Melioribacteraceae bacterium]|nr:heparinase II/III family protein [Melioribacteraceae bacterium]
MEKLNVPEVTLNSIWDINPNMELSIEGKIDENPFFVFGVKVDPNNIDWHKDLFSEFKYPFLRFDKIRYGSYFDQGIDLVFPWELSRFYFAPLLAQKYILSKDEKYYSKFKTLCLHWIEKNPFLYGVNWISTMDVSIRAINWITAINIFGEIVKNDTVFLKAISKSLFQHGEYISKFPAVYEKNITTNHTTAAFTGLLIISLSFPELSKAAKWQKQSYNGLVEAMDSQVYNDGVNFESAICYHKLVTEFFVYSVIFAHSKGILFPNYFLVKLFKMLEFIASYIDDNGHAPQFGDNDSGRVIILSQETSDFYKNEDDHRYLLELGTHLFENDFNWSKSNISKWLPNIKKVSVKELNYKPIDYKKSYNFKNGGFYILKNSNFHLVVGNCPLGQNGRGGHNNIDTGSFTLSVLGKPLIVDPGSYCYSRDRKTRDKFRHYTYHNTLITKEDYNLDISENGYWGLKKYYFGELIEFTDNIIEMNIKDLYSNNVCTRRFTLSENELIIEDKLPDEFFLRMNLIPDTKLMKINDSEYFCNEIGLNFTFDSSQIVLDQYDYSPHYGKKEESLFIKIKSKNHHKCCIKRIDI